MKSTVYHYYGTERRNSSKYCCRGILSVKNWALIVAVYSLVSGDTTSLIGFCSWKLSRFFPCCLFCYRLTLSGFSLDQLMPLDVRREEVMQQQQRWNGLQLSGFIGFCHSKWDFHFALPCRNAVELLPLKIIIHAGNAAVELIFYSSINSFSLYVDRELTV